MHCFNYERTLPNNTQLFYLTRNYEQVRTSNEDIMWAAEPQFERFCQKVWSNQLSKYIFFLLFQFLQDPALNDGL